MAKNIFVLSTLKILCQEELVRLAEVHKTFKSKLTGAPAQVETYDEKKPDQGFSSEPEVRLIEDQLKVRDIDQVGDPLLLKNSRPVIKEGEENTILPTDIVLWYKQAQKQTTQASVSKSKISGFYQQNQFIIVKKIVDEGEEESTSSTNGVLVNKKLA